MKKFFTEETGTAEYASPELQNISVSMENGFCQSSWAGNASTSPYEDDSSFNVDFNN